ncbi:putative cation/proton exchanger domain protein [Candidatus Erwinia dacicola]|uniref:Cation/proton exchanger domain protein n=1 Tax=Candidatus Erwinia dacicola TaxID=252393 RepID=A0A328TU97_9GAMM|nr:putative cation/proton exchanger domain protein [Candidatus Erwinia dacicola]
MIAGALKGEDDIAIGNLIVSNIYNMVIVLGIPALNLPKHARLRSFRP